MFGKKNKKDNWFKTAKIARRKGRLPEPYYTLLQYYSCIAFDNWEGDHGGHFDYFCVSAYGGHTSESIAALRSILPKDLLENFEGALVAYDALGEDPEYEDVEKALDEFDDYADEHSDEIADILRNYVAEMSERHCL